MEWLVILAAKFEAIPPRKANSKHTNICKTVMAGLSVKAHNEYIVSEIDTCGIVVLGTT